MSIYDEARTVFDEHGRTDEAIDRLARHLNNAELRPEALRYAASGLLMYTAHDVRGQIRGVGSRIEVNQRPGDGAQQQTEAEADEVDEITRPRPRYADWPLSRGSRLWTATREEILAHAEQHESQAAGHARVATFERAVARRLRRGQRPSEALTPEQIQRIGVRIFEAETAGTAA